MPNLYGHTLATAGLDGPTVTVIGDSTTGQTRTLTLRVKAPQGTTAIVVQVRGASVHRASIDGRVVDTTRFRERLPTWATEYWNVPADGALFAFDVDAGAALAVEVAARRPGLPASAGSVARPSDVVTTDTGDASVVTTSTRF
jgi:RNase P/RNase MRP subunit p29